MNKFKVGDIIHWQEGDKDYGNFTIKSIDEDRIYLEGIMDSFSQNELTLVKRPLKVPDKLTYSNGTTDGIVIFYYSEGNVYPMAIDKDVLDAASFIIGTSGATIIDQPIEIKLEELKGETK